MRILDQKAGWRLDNETYQRAMRALRYGLASVSGINAVIGIENGGKQLGLDLSSELEVPYHFIKARHNASSAPYSETLEAVSIIDHNISADILSGVVILVDDIVGTGKTMIEARAVIEDLHLPHSIVIVTLCRNEGSIITPDLFVWIVREWVTFPWEDLHQSIEMKDLVMPASLSGSLR